jgi:hypothetical protein
MSKPPDHTSGELFPLPPAPRPAPPLRLPPRAADRPHRADRAGTPLDHRFTIEVFGLGPKSRRHTSAGWIDRRHRLFKKNLLTFQGDVWVQLTTRYADALDFLELVDNVANRAYRVDFRTACERGCWYDEGIGRRWGIPADLWTVHDAA